MINGRNDTVLWDVITGYDPVSLIYDPSSGYVYALNAGLPPAPWAHYPRSIQPAPSK